MYFFLFIDISHTEYDPNITHNDDNIAIFHKFFLNRRVLGWKFLVHVLMRDILLDRQPQVRDQHKYLAKYIIDQSCIAECEEQSGCFKKWSCANSVRVICDYNDLKHLADKMSVDSYFWPQ